MKFRFRLAKVLQLAELREDAASRQLMAAQAAARAAVVSLEEARKEFGVTLVVQADRLCGKLDFPAIIAGNGHLDFLQGRVGKEEGQVAARQTELSARQDELGQALQRRRVLEKLQERQKFQHNKDEERREAMLLDGLPVPERR